jgi:hypothetical protein
MSEPDPFLVGVVEALHEVTQLLRYSIEDNYMSDYDAQCAASSAIQALTKLLPMMNL